MGEDHSGEKKEMKISEPFQQFIYTMDRLFSGKPTNGLLQSMDDFFATASPFGGFPVELTENENEYIVKAQLPGVKKQQIEIEVIPQYVAITVHQHQSIKKEDINNAVTHKKAMWGQSSRTIPLSKPIIHNRATARYENGVLTIQVPKKKGKKINID